MCKENGHIYIISTSESKIKIGRSKNPERRIRVLETQGGNKIINFFITDLCSNYCELELKMHKIFKENRIIGEWFNADFDLAVKVLLEQKLKLPRYKTKEEIKNEDKKMQRIVNLCVYGNEEGTLELKDNLKEFEYHCEYCMCPIDKYEPLKTYNNDRGCELYCRFYDIIDELEDSKCEYSFLDILKESDNLRNDFKDINCFESTLKELIEISIDCGVITELYTLY